MKQVPFLLGLFLVSLLSCRKNGQLPPDPCAEAQQPKVDFYIQEEVGDSLIKTDKVMEYGFVVFEAAGTYASYRWMIGEDARIFTERKVRLLFKYAIPSLKVTLIATPKPNACFPDAPKEERITKTFSVIPWKECPILGTYIGSFQSRKAKTDTVRVILIPQPDGWDRIALINVNPGCNADTTISWSTERGAYAYRFNSDNAFYSGCLGPDAWLRLKGKDTLTINYTYKEKTPPSNGSAVWPVLKDNFTGIRLK